VVIDVTEEIAAAAGSRFPQQ